MASATKALSEALQTAEEWVDAFVQILAWRDREKALSAMIAAFHALRDSLPWTEAVYLGSYLPPVLRGYYYEGWHPESRALPFKSRSAFLKRILDVMHEEPAIDAERVGRGLFSLLASRLPPSEVEDAKAVTPEELRAFWPS